MSLLEEARQAHELCERYEREIANIYRTKPATEREKILQQHQVTFCIGKIHEYSQKLKELYADEDGLRRAEADAFTGPHVFAAFNRQLRELRDYHQLHGANDPRDAMAIDTLEDDQLVQFSGEEHFGKHLDLHHLYERFINMPQFSRCDYASFLDRFNQFQAIPRELKDAAYQGYLTELRDYLASFHRRTRPLLDFPALEARIEAEFQLEWERGMFPGWHVLDEAEWPPASMQARNTRNNPAMDVEGVESPFYCKACCRAFAKESVFAAHQRSKKHLKAERRMRSYLDPRTDAAKRPVALLEAQIVRYTQLLEEEIEATKAFIEKKQVQNPDEIMAEAEEEIPIEDEDEDEYKEPVQSNPKGFPLGWDGKPIPVWLYKLNGLGLEFKCEICGNASYWGPKAFEKHFQEWRHAHGMRCLKIPNTKHFMYITQIEDAYALYEKIKKQSLDASFLPDEDEEFEDRDGNVYSRKTYDFLKKQGLA